MTNNLEMVIGLHRRLDLIRQVSIFRHLPDNILLDLSRRMTIKRWVGGALIVAQHEVDSSLFIIYAGRAKVALFGDNGREMTLSVLGAGDFFGEMSLVDKKPRSANVVALDDSILLILDREAFLDHLKAHPETAMALLGVMTQRLRQSDEMIANLALHDVQSRLVRTLVALAEETGESHDEGMIIRYRPTQQDLANMVGTCRETVSRALSAMARRGQVVSRGRTLLLRHTLVDQARRQAA